MKLAKFLAAVLSPFNVMVRYCCYCNSIMGFKRGGRGITTGMCDDCYRDLQEKQHLND